MGGRRRVEIGDAGRTLFLEKELVVAERADPAAGVSQGSRRSDLRSEIRNRTDTLLRAVDFLSAPRERDQMKMCVDESRENRRPRSAEHLRSCMAQAEDLRLVTES